MPSAASTDIRQKGYIIRTYRLSETSLIVEWLTESEGRVPTVAKGALRKKSNYAGKLDVFFLANMSYRPSQRSDLHQLKEVELLSTPSKIRRSLKRLNQVAYFVDLIRRTTETCTPLEEVFQLFHQSIRVSEEQYRGSWFTLWFEWQLLGILGLQLPLQSSGLPNDERQILEAWSTGSGVDYEHNSSSVGEIASFLGHSWAQELGKNLPLRSQVLSDGVRTLT